MAGLYDRLASDCAIDERTEDAFRYVVCAYLAAETAGVLDEYIVDLASTVNLVSNIVESAESVEIALINSEETRNFLEFLHNAVSWFPGEPGLHYFYSKVLNRFGPKDKSVTSEKMLVEGSTRTYSEGKPPHECLTHAYRAVELDPKNRDYVDWACWISELMCDWAA